MTAVHGRVVAAVSDRHEVDVPTLAGVLPAAVRAELGLPCGDAPAARAADGVLEPYLVDDLASAQVVHLTETEPSGHRRGALVVGGAALLVVHGLERLGRRDGRGGRGAGDDVRLEVETMPASALPLALGRFAGLRPTDVVEGRAARLADADLARRLHDADAPVPADAPEWLAQAWARPWRLWSVAGADLARLDHLDTGDGGQIGVRQGDDGDLVVTARPEGLVWGDLQRIPGALAAARGDVDPDAADW